MEFGSIFSDSGAFLARWLHIYVGIIWIGLLYYFNFVQTPFFAETEAPVRSGAIQKLVPRALKWFAWGAALTLITGLYLLYLNAADNMKDYWTSPSGVIISVGATFGLMMFLNVMIAILPNQRIVIESTKGVAAGKPADPRQPAAANAAAVASRTNALFSVPLLFAMAGTTHMSAHPDTINGKAGLYYVIMFGLIAICQANVYVFKKMLAPLKTPKSVIIAGFVFALVFYVVLNVCFPKVG